MSIPENMSNQSALLRANSSVKESDGTWYRKANISGPVLAPKKLAASKSKQQFASPNTDEIRDSLFHFNCWCSMCKDFDLAKSDTTVSNSSYAEVVSSSGKTVKTDLNRKDKDLPSWKSKAQKTEKVSSTQSFDTKMYLPPPLFSSSGHKGKGVIYREERALNGGEKQIQCLRFLLRQFKLPKSMASI